MLPLLQLSNSLRYSEQVIMICCNKCNSGELEQGTRGDCCTNYNIFSSKWGVGEQMLHFIQQC